MASEPLGIDGTVENPYFAGHSANRQCEKQTFLANAGRTDAFGSGKLLVPVSPYELKVGSVIPGALITAINVDLLGQIFG